MFFYWSKKERNIRKVLKRLAKQTFHSTENNSGRIYWYIANAVTGRGADENTALMTCLFRGWVQEQPYKTMVTFCDAEKKQKIHTVVRLTDAGWKIIRSEYQLLVFILAIALLTLVVTAYGVINSLSL